jgi:hypothetical protein
MASIRDDTIGGFNSFIASQEGGTMSLILFDHEVQEIYKDIPMNEVKPLTDFVPRGSTALLDAMGHVLKTYSGKKTIVVLTDGYENSSTKYTHSHIKDLVEMRKKDGWDFVYLGADIKEGQDLGFHTVVKFEGENTGELFHTLSCAMTQASQTGTHIEL